MLKEDKPILINGKPVAVIGMVYNRDDFRDSLIFSINKIWIFVICGMALAMAFILAVLYRRSVSPVLRLRNAVISYTKDKNAAEIVSYQRAMLS